MSIFDKVRLSACSNEYYIMYDNVWEGKIYCLQNLSLDRVLALISMMWEGESECFNSLIFSVWEWKIYCLYQLLPHVCLGRGQALTLTLCVGWED